MEWPMRTLMQTLQEHAGGSRQTDAPSPTVGQASDTTKVLKLLYRQDRKGEDARIGSKFVHASSFSRLPRCARMFYLANYMKEQGVTYPETVFGSMRLVWAFGRAAENHVRDTLLMDPEMRRAAYGLWKCSCGHTKQRGHLSPSPRTCDRCRTKVDRYGEPVMFDKVHGITGSPDFMYLDNGRYQVIEIKSIKGETTNSAPGFDTMDKAQPAHIEQGTHYIRLGENDGMVMHPTPHVLYIKKEFDPRNWYKLSVPTAKAQERAYEDVDDCRRVSREYTEALSSGRIPPLIQKCQDSPSACQKSCVVWAECMSRAAS